MTVTVMYRNNWFGGDGWTYFPVTVQIADTCPKCGGPRGEKQWTQQQCEDGEWFQLSRWENACGHLDTYADVLVESGYAKRPAPKATA